MDSSSDADMEVFYPPRTNLRPRPITLDIAPDVACSPHDTTQLDPLDTALEETIDDTVNTTLLQSPAQQADSLQTILADHAYIPEDTTWTSELATRRQVARDWLRANPTASLPWHFSTVLTQDIFDDDIRARIRQFPVNSGPPTSLTALYPSTSDDDNSTLASFRTHTDAAGHLIKSSTRLRKPNIPAGGIPIDAIQATQSLAPANTQDEVQHSAPSV